MKRVLVSVINDLVTDQRVHRTCSLLHEEGYEVVLIGRKLKNSLVLEKRSYECKRMSLLFENGPLFYAEYNSRLFLLLLTSKSNLLFSNDLDTLLPNFIISKLKGKRLVYDSHEYFTEVPELIHRPRVQKVWKWIESFVLTRIESMITVNESIANLFREKYRIKVEVIRNVPIGSDVVNFEKEEKLLVLQGAGINVDRGGEELLSAMEFIDGKLWVIGDGDALPKLKDLVKEKSLETKVSFKGKVPLSELKELTAKAQIGFSLDKDSNINYRYSLPNKLFDYLQASCAVICSNLVEVNRIVEDFKVGLVLEEVSPSEIAKTVNRLFEDSDLLQEFQSNAFLASKELTWDKEQSKLRNILKN